MAGFEDFQNWLDGGGDEDPLTKLAAALAAQRMDAVKQRKKDGLDRIFQKAREQYIGIDELNRPPLMEGAPTLDGPLTPFITKDDIFRSTVFVNITRPYTNTGTARVADIYLPTNKMPWQLKQTPISDLANVMLMMQQFPQEAQAALEQTPELAQMIQEMGDPKAAMAAAELLIKDWLVECNWTGKMRKCIEEGGQVGTGIIKGPVPEARKLSPEIQSFTDALPPHLGKELQVSLKFRPVVDLVKVENLFPDPKCGPDIHNGAFVWERIPDNSKAKLKELMLDPSYFPEQILACLKEGPKDELGKPKVEKRSRAYDFWLFTGWITIPEGGGIEFGNSEASIFLTLTMCNDRVIKVGENLLRSEKFPYRMFVWEEREDSWAGIGIPEKIETPQRGLNAAVRALNDNMGYSVGPQVLKVLGMIEPEDGDPQLSPYKHWLVKLDGITSSLDDVKKAITFLEFENYLDRLLPVVQLWLKLAEDTAELPLILQGQASTDAVGLGQQLQNNATTNLRLIIKRVDTDLTTPVIRDFYEWSQIYGPPAVKGDAVPEAIGSSVLLTKELQQQALLQLLDRAVQPAFGLSPKKAMRAILEGFQFDPEKLEPDAQEQAQLEAAANQPDPKVQVAQIQAAVDEKLGMIEAQIKEMKLQLDTGMKGAQLQHGKDVAETQAAAQIAQQGMKDDSALQREKVKQRRAVKQRAPAKLAPVQPIQQKPPENVDQALGVLGLG
jgi:hypothetical protein